MSTGAACTPRPPTPIHGLIHHLGSREMVDLADETYRYFQLLGQPARRVGRPFVSHGHRLYPSK